MQRSTDRVLTTHVGSLARPEPLLDTMREKEHGRPYDADLFARQVTDAVAEVVAKQREVGIDVVTDGEMGKVSFATYIQRRLGGFEPASSGERLLPPSWQLEIDAFPEYYDGYLGKYSKTVAPMVSVACTGPVSYIGHDELQTDIANLHKAVAGVSGVVETFMPSTSPRGFGRNAYYATDREYYEAVGEALREEYLAIIEAGFLLQIDDPWLIEILSDPTLEPAERDRTAREHAEIVNHSLRGVPTERIRLHTCYGLNHGPRVHDISMGEVAPYMLGIQAGGYSFEVANPRHMHEWKVWEDPAVRNALPDGAVLIPGLLGHAQNYVEHPELIADMIGWYASCVGRENVIASADCGFSSRASYAPEVHPSVVWEKFRALSEGAAIATSRLWS
jgi:5-methyltetrahydropteroyltriglutamate--homocysteine methyltransferase